MKKNSKVIRKDYSKLDALDDYRNLEYWGLIKKDGRVLIDTKRWLKKGLYLPNEAKLRKTVYFKPEKEYRDDYYCNRFIDLIRELKNEWNNELVPIIKKLKTPRQVEDEVRVDSMADGIFEYDEANIHAMMQGMKRTAAYYKMIGSIYGQFVLYFFTVLESETLKVMNELGYENPSFNKNFFEKFFNSLLEKNRMKLEKIDSYSHYDMVRKVNNFLKHSSLDTYKKIKDKYSHLLIKKDDDTYPEYMHGDYGLWFLKIDDTYLDILFKKLPAFYSDLFKYSIDENVETASWNYDKYFIRRVRDEIENIDNPLGLPPYI